MLLSHQVLDGPRVTPGQNRVHAFHPAIKPVVGLVANRHDAGHAAWSVANQFGQLGNFAVAGNVFGIANT